MSRFHRRIVSLVSIFAVVTLLGGCKRPEREGDNGDKSESSESAETEVRKETIFLSPVLVQKAERGELLATIAVTGSVVPLRTLAVRTEEAGRLRFAREWIEGDRIEKGDLVAHLESPSLMRELEINKADVQIQKEALDLAERTLESRLNEYRTLADLYAQGISAEKEVDAARLELERARNSQRQDLINLEKAESRVREIRERVESLEIRATASGLIVSRATFEGSGKFTTGFGREAIADFDGLQVSSGHVVCGVADTSQVFMRCDVTARDISLVRTGQQTDVSVYARDNMMATGEVARVSNSVNPDTRAFEVDVLLANADSTLKPGMFGKAEIVTDRRRDALAVPRNAVTVRNGQDVAFVVEEPVDTKYKVARMVPVETGLETRDDIEITFGVQEGQQVIIRGFEVLQDSTPINPIDVDAPIRPDEQSESMIEVEVKEDEEEEEAEETTETTRAEMDDGM